jgi:magnesium transporter
MLSAFIPQPQGLARFELRAGAAIPGEAIWLDLIEPTPSEERQVESFLSIDVPTRDEMREIEASTALQKRTAALATATVITPN